MTSTRVRTLVVVPAASTAMLADGHLWNMVIKIYSGCYCTSAKVTGRVGQNTFAILVCLYLWVSIHQASLSVRCAVILKSSDECLDPRLCGVHT